MTQTQAVAVPQKPRQVLAPTTGTASVFALMDRLDDAVVMRELGGSVSGKWLYKFTTGGKEIVGMGKVGVDQCSILLAEQGYILRDLDVQCAPDPTSKNGNAVLFHAKVQKVRVTKEGQEVPLETVIGTKRQTLAFRRKDGTVVNDEHWYEKGSAKALRNARLRLIPEDIKTRVQALALRAPKSRVEVIQEEATEVSPEYEAAANGYAEDVPATRQQGPNDADVPEGEVLPAKPAARRSVSARVCSECSQPVSDKVADYSAKKHGRVLCFDHQPGNGSQQGPEA